jgi:predicted TPR repeat methyltransferase
MVPILIRAAFAYFLWRDAIAELFRVDTRTKKRTALITAGDTLLFLGALNIVFH